MRLNNLKEGTKLPDRVVVVKPPHEPHDHYKDNVTIFLAGSIEMGKAEDWQADIADELETAGIKGVTIFNPRRDDWDSSWEQSIDNPNFNEQVTWEMDHLEQADIIIFYLDPETKSPITLMELGLHAEDDNIIVCCPDGFWRKGNIEMICDRFNIPLVNTYKQLLSKIQTMIENKQVEK